MSQITPLTTRVARPSDARALVALVNSAYRGDSSRAGWTTEADLLGGQRTDEHVLIEFIARGETAGDRAMLVHEREGRLIACVQLERRKQAAYLGMLTIMPTRQSGGLGKALLAAAENFVLHTWNGTSVTMTVIEQRPELIAWYGRRGYSRTGDTAPFPYGDARFGEPKRPDLKFVVLSKRLGAAPPSP
ncbi:MAG: GNAT family N-acetyltransferase [Gammaproteobacteria bacterium]|nr:GNAT family N-acetyltransferase [Gammaproteobacteria bacterium]